MTYEQAKERRDVIEKAASAAGAVLRAFPSGPMGLTPDNVKALPEWREARRAYAEAFERLRSFNAWFLKTYAKEYRAERRDRRAVQS